MKTIVGVLTAALLAVLSCATPAGAAPSPCATAWGSDIEQNYTITTDGAVQPAGGGGNGREVRQIRTGSDACWDRVVFELAGPPGPAVWYHVGYVDEVRQEGSGAVVPVPGAAKLSVALTQEAVAPALIAPGAVDGYPTLRSVVYTGGFEGLGAGIGVRERLPFRVFTLSGPDRVVIDIAHR